MILPISLRRRTALAAAVFCLISVMAIPAGAHDHAPPRSVLRVPDTRQQGRPFSSFWTTADGRFCIDQKATNTLAFPKAVNDKPGRQVVIVLRKDEKPTEVSLEAWKAVRKDGTPRGDAESIPLTLTPKMRLGTITAWKVSFLSAAGGRHYYLRLEAQWQDQEGCGGDPDLGYQHAAWTYLLKTS